MKFLLLALTIAAQPLVSPDVLEPSVQNEVDHALARAPTNAVPVDATQLAIALVSAQRADGRWTVGTNDVTQVVVAILSGLSAPHDDTPTSSSPSRP